MKEDTERWLGGGELIKGVVEALTAGDEEGATLAVLFGAKVFEGVADLPGVGVVD